MKSAKKYLAAIIAVMHLLTYSAPVHAQVAEDAGMPPVDSSAGFDAGLTATDVLPPVSVPVPDTTTPVDTTTSPAAAAATAAPTQITLHDGETLGFGSLYIGADQKLFISIVDLLGNTCPSCHAVMEGSSFVNDGLTTIIGILALISPTIINNGTITVEGDLLLSNLGINKEQFFAGVAEFTKDPATNGFIVNTGEIRNLSQGLIALVGANGGVHNFGTISSNGGAVALVAGDKASFPLTNDGMLNIALDGLTGVKGQVFDKNGKLVETKGLVTNSGLLQANGGAVVLQAKGAEAVYDSIINHTGIIEAKSVSEVNGKIILGSETGNIRVTNATIDASGLHAGEKGGSVQILTKGNVVVEGTTKINASGTNGGGEVLIGSDQGVTGPITAQNVFVGSDVTVKADAIENGNGGKIIVGAREVALAYGNFSAKGGAQSGNGGFIETSGKEYLDVDGAGVDASAAHGLSGTWLLDPRSVEVVSSVTNPGGNQQGSFSGGTWTPDGGNNAFSSQILASQIKTLLEAGTNVILNTAASPVSQIGNITVSAAITKALGGNVTLTLTTAGAGGIFINAAITATVGLLNVVLASGATGAINLAANISTNGGNLTMTAGTGGISQTAGAVTANLVSFTAGGAVSLAQAGNIWNTITGTTTTGAVNIADSVTDTTIQNLQTIGNTVTYSHTGTGNVTVTGTVSSGNGSTNGGNISINSSNALTTNVGSSISSAKNSGALGTLTVSGATVNGTTTLGTGNITLTGTSLDTIINTVINQATNYIISAVRDVIVTSSITTTAGASVSLTGDSDLNGNGGVWIKNTGSIDSAGNVTLTGSAINDAGAAGESIRVDADGSNNQILAAGDITLQKSSAAPSTADIEVNGIVKTTGVGKTITVNSNDQINSSDNGVAEFIGDNLSLTAKNGMNVESDVKNASYNNSTSGNVAIEDMTGGLTVNGATNGGAGSTTITTHSPLTIAANMIQAGAINLSAGESAAATDLLTVNSGVTVESTGGSVTLNAGDNVVLNTTSIVKSDTSTVSITAGNGDTDNIGSVTLSGLVSAATTLTLNAITVAGGALGLINQTAGSVVATDLVLNSDDSATLNQAANSVTTLKATTGGDVTYQDASGLDLKASTVGGNLNLTTAGAITESGVVSVNTAGKTATFAAGTGNDITLDTQSNLFKTVAITSGKNVNLKDADSLNFGASTVSGALAVTTSGAITDSGAIVVNGGTNLTAGAANNITLDNLNDFQGAVKINSGNDVAVNDINGIDIGASTVGGNLNVTTAGAITQSGAIIANGAGKTATFAAGSGNNVNLGGANDFTTVAITIGKNVTLNDVNALNLGASTVSGNLNVTTAGAITQSGAIINNVAGKTVTFAAGSGNNITLGGANDFTTAAITSGKDVILNDMNALNLGASTISGNLNVTTNGAITESGVVSVNTAGKTATFAAGTGNDITLDTQSNLFKTVAITSGKNVNLKDADSLNFGASTVSGALAVTTSGAITDSGAIVVNGGTNLTAGIANNITLDNNNNFQGAVKINSGKDVSINSNALDLGDSTVTGTLDVATVGALSDSGTVIADKLKFSAGTTATLDSANNDFNTIAGTANGAVKIRDVNSLSVGTVNGTDGINSTNHNVEVISGGNITLDKAVNAGSGDATLTATGFIREGGPSDDATPVADVIAKNIYLNSQVAALGDALGLSSSYLDLQVTDTVNGSWNVGVPNSGNVYINCIGDCPIGQVNVGTGTFNFSTSGVLLDGNDPAPATGEFATPNAGVWNITAGGINIKTSSGFGTETNAIETRLSNFGGVAGDGKAAIDGGTGGVFLANASQTGFGLTIGGITGSFVSGIASKTGTSVYSGSPLTIAANIIDNGGGDIFLAALGNAATDNLTVNANVTATGGNGEIALIAGNNVFLGAGTVVSTVGTGVVEAIAGENATDGVQNQDGNANGSVQMNSTSNITSAGGTITLDARKDIALSLVNAAAGVVSLLARAGAITDANTNGVNNVASNTLSATAAAGIDLDTDVNSVNALNSTSGAIKVRENNAVTLTSVINNGGNVDVKAGGTITATDVQATAANKDVTIKATSGDILTSNVAAKGIATLTANNGSIKDNNAAAVNVTAKDLIASSKNGIDLDTKVKTITAKTSNSGDINIDEADGANILNVNAVNGNATVTSATGDLDVASMFSSATTTITATAGSIHGVADDGVSDVSGATVNLNALNGNIRGATSLDALDVTATTKLNASTAAGNGNIKLDSIGNSIVGLITTGSLTAGNVILNSTGSINPFSHDGVADIVAKTLTLVAKLGGIGIPSGLEVTVGTGGINADTTAGNNNINITSLADAVIGLVTAGTGNVEFDSTGKIDSKALDGVADFVGGTLNLTSAVGGIGNTSIVEVTVGAALNADTAAGDDSAIKINSIGNLPIGVVNAGAGDVTLNSTGNMTDANDGATPDSPAVTNVVGGTINLNATGDIGTLTNAVDFLASTQFNANTAASGANIFVRSTGNAPVGLIDAGTGNVDLKSEGNITDANDGATPDAPGVLNINGGRIDLETVNGNDIGEFINYVEIQPSTAWGAKTHGGDLYVTCIGTCPMDQVDLGTGTFYYAGNITDANDTVNGEVNLGVWNLTAGGAHIKADGAANGFIGAANNWIETRLKDYAGVVDTAGRLVGTAGTGGIHISDDRDPADLSLDTGLQIGGVSPSSITGLASSGNIEVYSFSPLTVAANVTATGGSSINLHAMGNTANDDLTINNGVTVSSTGGNGNILLTAGDRLLLDNNSLVSTTGTGTIIAFAGEDYTNGVLDFDGNSDGNVRMDAGSAFRSEDGDITVNAVKNVRITEVNADSDTDNTRGDIYIEARNGYISDRNGGAVNLTGDNAVLSANKGIGDTVVADDDEIETNLNTIDLINSVSGHANIVEVAAGGALGIIRAYQQGGGDLNIRTTNGDLTVLDTVSLGQGVSATTGRTHLEANGSGFNDDLIVNNTVDSTTGKIELYSTSRDVKFSAAGDVTATGGAEIEVNAKRDITMADGTVLNANGGGVEGGIDLDAGRDITLGSVQTTSSLSTDLNGDAFDAVQIDAGRKVIDGGDADTDIIAENGQTTINAVRGIGDGDQIDTQMKAVRLTNTTAGDVQIHERAIGGNLDIIGADQQALNGDLRIHTTNGTLTVLEAGLGGVGVTAVDGITRLFARDNDVSGGDNLVINNTVRSADGKINLDSENDVIASAEGDVTSGDTSLKAGATGAEIEVNAIGNITMADGTVFNANAGGPNGSIDMDALNGNITLGSVQTTSQADSAVVIYAQNGAIIDGGDTDTNIVTGAATAGVTGTGGGMLLKAKTGIGSRGTGVASLDPDNAANNFATDAIDTQGGRLAAQTETGDIQISNTGGLEITTLSDNDGASSYNTPGAGTVTGILNNDAGHVDPASIIFVTTHSPMTISSAVTNLDGGNISLYALGSLPTDTMTINANVQSKNGNGDLRIVSGGSMTLGAGVQVSTQGDSLTSGTGQVTVGAGYNATGKARDADASINPLYNALSLPLNPLHLASPSTNGVGSLLDTVGNAGANLTMDETARISTEDGNIIADAQNNFTVGRVDADGNTGVNGITDGVRGNIYGFARNGSILDAEGPGEVRNLDFVANSLNLLAAGTIGLPGNHIEGDAPFLNTFSVGSQFVDMSGDTQVEMLSAAGNIFLTATNNIILGHVAAPLGEAHLKAGNDISSLGSDGTRVTASNLIELIAGGVVGTTANPIFTHLNATPAQINLSAGHAGGNGVSAAIFSNVSPAALNMLNNPPGLVLFNAEPIAGASLPGLIGNQSSLYNKPFVRGLRQYSDIDGNYAADFPGYNNYENLASSPDLDVDTSALDQIPVRGLTTAPRVVPIPTPAKPTPVQSQQVVETPKAPEAPVLSKEPTPPAVVSIPGKATPSNESKTNEGVPQTPSASN